MRSSDPFLLLREPRLLINLLKNWLSSIHTHTHTHTQSGLCMHRLCIHGFNQLRIKNIREKDSRKFQKVKPELPCAGNYIHSIYIVLGIMCNLEIFKVLERVYVDYMQIVQHFMRFLSIPGFWYGGPSWNQSPTVTEG